MCEIVATRDAEGVWTQTLSGADANAIMELNEHNTMNGGVRVYVVQADAAGVALIPNPRPGEYLYYDARNLADAASAPFRLVVAPPAPPDEGGVARGVRDKDARGGKDAAETQAGPETITWVEEEAPPPDPPIGDARSEAPTKPVDGPPPVPPPVKQPATGTDEGGVARV